MARVMRMPVMSSWAARSRSRAKRQAAGQMAQAGWGTAGKGLVLDGYGADDAGRGHQDEREDADVEHEHVRYLGPAEEGSGDEGDVPAGAGAVQDEPGGHYRD